MPMVLTFGERVAFLRRRRGWTQADLAAKLGVRGNTISRIEKSTHGKGGFEDVKGKTVAALARHLRVSADYLLGLSEDDHEIPWSLLPSAEDRATPSLAAPPLEEEPTPAAAPAPLWHGRRASPHRCIRRSWRHSRPRLKDSHASKSRRQWGPRSPWVVCSMASAGVSASAGWGRACLPSETTPAGPRKEDS